MSKKQVWEVEPLKGIGPVQLGMAQSAVQQALGQPEQVLHEEDSTVHVYLQEQFFVFYDDNQQVADLEAKAFQSATLTIKLFGLDVFAHNGDDLVQEIERISDSFYDPNDPANPYSFTFSELGLSLFRPVIPADYEDDEEDDEHGKGLFFQSLGLSLPEPADGQTA